ncbi:MAG: MFS transporter, partial [Ilumatobacteraceae bacterium]
SMSETEQPHILSAREVLRTPGVLAFLLANLTFYVGIMLQATTLGKHVFDITDRELDIGWLGLAEFAPALLFALVTGTVADHFNRKHVALIALAAEAVCSVALMFYAQTLPTSAMPIFALAFFFGVARAFLSPALRPIAPMIAPDGGIPRVVAFYSATWTGAVIIGPAASGFLYAAAPWIAYAVAAVMIGLGTIALSTVKVPHDKARQKAAERPTVKHAMEGVRFIRQTPILLAVISLDLFAVLFGGAVALLPVIAEEQLNVGDIAYGWLRAAGGIGAAIMAIFLAFRPVRRKVGRVLLLVVGVFGVSTIVLGLTHSYVVAFVAVLVLSAADMVSVFIRGSIAPLVTPDEKRGRVSAMENVFIGASNELGAFESGAVSSLVGTPTTVIAGGIATLGVVGAYWYKFPALRDVDTFDELEPAVQ